MLFLLSLGPSVQVCRVFVCAFVCFAYLVIQILIISKKKSQVASASRAQNNCQTVASFFDLMVRLTATQKILRDILKLGFEAGGILNCLAVIFY